MRRRARRDGRRRAGARRAAAGDRRTARGRAGGSSSSTRSRTTTTPPASRCPRSGGPRSSTICRERRRAGRSRTTPTACSASTGSRYRALRADEAERGDLPRVVLQDLRARVPGRLGAGAARRPREAGARPGVATLCPPAFSQMAVSAYLAQHDWLGQVKQFREMYRERRDAMVEALARHDAGQRPVERADGGFYVWLTLPPGLDAKAMLPRAVTARVAYVPGTAFFADGFGGRCMRLSYCYPHAGADPGGRTPAGRRDRGGAGAARDLRRHWPRTAIELPPQRRTTLADGPDTRSVSRPRVLVLAGGLSTSATSRCAPGAGWPRRCARPASRSTSATSDADLLAALRDDPPACVRAAAARRDRRGRRAARGARAGRHALRRRPARRPAGSRSTSRSPRRWSAAPASPRRRRCACRTRPSASSARPR